MVAKSQELFLKFDRYIKGDPEGRQEWVIPMENDIFEMLEKNGKLSQQLSRLSHDLDLFYKKFKKLETFLKSSISGTAPTQTDTTLAPLTNNGGKSITIAPGPDNKKLAALHVEFVKTLGKIGGDLQETAARLKTFHSESNL